MYNDTSPISREEYLYNLSMGMWTRAKHKRDCDVCGNCGMALPRTFDYGEVCDYCGVINIDDSCGSFRCDGCPRNRS